LVLLPWTSNYHWDLLPPALHQLAGFFFLSCSLFPPTFFWVRLPLFKPVASLHLRVFPQLKIGHLNFRSPLPPIATQEKGVIFLLLTTRFCPNTSFLLVPLFLLLCVLLLSYYPALSQEMLSSFLPLSLTLLHPFSLFFRVLIALLCLSSKLLRGTSCSTFSPRFFLQVHQLPPSLHLTRLTPLLSPALSAT